MKKIFRFLSSIPFSLFAFFRKIVKKKESFTAFYPDLEPANTKIVLVKKPSLKRKLVCLPLQTRHQKIQKDGQAVSFVGTKSNFKKSCSHLLKPAKKPRGIRASITDYH